MEEFWNLIVDIITKVIFKSSKRYDHIGLRNESIIIIKKKEQLDEINYVIKGIVITFPSVITRGGK